MTDSEIFDRRLRRTRRDRAAAMPLINDKLLRYFADDIIERVDLTERVYDQALLIGLSAPSLIDALCKRVTTLVTADAGHSFATPTGGIQCDEDRLPFVDASFDLIISFGVLDSVNDVPGAMVLMRRALKPDGMMITMFAGVGSLDTMRATLRSVDPATQRTHPQIDVRAGGDLLARAGFVRPVADVDNITRDYADLGALHHALKAAALTNTLLHRSPITRQTYTDLCIALGIDQPITETLSVVTLTGWAPT